MYRTFFKFVKNKIPRISDTEMIALKSGNTSTDRDILKGKLVYPKKVETSQKFNIEKINNLLEDYDNSSIYPNNNNNLWINKLAKDKYFSFLIDEKYGGIKLSVNELSSVLTKIMHKEPFFRCSCDGPKFIRSR